MAIDENAILCVCGARAGYRITRGSRVIYRCPCCATHYDNVAYDVEPLPHIVAMTACRPERRAS